MSDENQATPPPDETPAPAAGGGSASELPPQPASHPVFEHLEPPHGWPAPAAPAPAPRRLVQGAFALALLGLVALLLGQVEASFFVALATLFFVAQGADAHPALGRVHALLAWLPPVLGAVLLGALAALLLEDRSERPLRLAFAAFAASGAFLSLAMLIPTFAHRLVRILFRGAGPSRTLRLGACAALVALWVGLPTRVVLRDELVALLQDPESLVNPSKLSGGLVGQVVLAFASIGYLVRRDGRAALARLGLTAPRLADALAVGGGVLALWLFNVATEAIERGYFPALWTADQSFAVALAGVMGPGQMLLLGLSAGIGEEITLRGALQPKLGIVLTSLLFAMLHVQYSWFGMLSILGFGLILGAIRQRRSTTAAILVHALYDLLAVAAARG